MSDLVGNPEDRFSRVAAHISLGDELILLWLPFHLHSEPYLYTMADGF